MQEFEDSHPLSGKSTADEDGGVLRRDAVGRLVALGRSLGLHEECIHDSVQLLDRLSRMGLSSESMASSVLGAIALISAKQGARNFCTDFCEPVAFESALNLFSISFFAPALHHAFEYLGVDR